MKKSKTTQLKYNLHKWLWELASQDEFDAVMNYLPEYLKVTKETLKKWIYIKVDEKHEMPACAMYLLCKFFHKTLDEMYSNPPVTTSMESIAFYETHGIIKK